MRMFKSNSISWWRPWLLKCSKNLPMIKLRARKLASLLHYRNSMRKTVSNSSRRQVRLSKGRALRAGVKTLSWQLASRCRRESQSRSVLMKSTTTQSWSSRKSCWGMSWLKSKKRIKMRSRPKVGLLKTRSLPHKNNEGPITTSNTNSPFIFKKITKYSW